MVGNIRNIDVFLKNLIPWDKLNGAFPRGICPSDIDGRVEINHNFLFMEAENVTKPISKRQRIADNRLGGEANKTYLYIKWLPKENEIVEFYNILRPDKILGTSWDDLYRRCQEWSAWAEKKDGRERLREQFGVHRS